MSGEKKKIPDRQASAQDFPILSQGEQVAPVRGSNRRLLRQVSWLPSHIGGLPISLGRDSGTRRPTELPPVQHRGPGLQWRARPRLARGSLLSSMGILPLHFRMPCRSRPRTANHRRPPKGADYWPSWPKSARRLKTRFPNACIFNALPRRKWWHIPVPRKTRKNQHFPGAPENWGKYIF